MKRIDIFPKRVVWISEYFRNRPNDISDQMKTTEIRQDQISEILIPVNRSAGYLMTCKVAQVGTISLVAIALLTVVACTPQTNVIRACSQANVTLTGRKDADTVNRFSQGIDVPMQDVMASSGALSCAVVVVGENRVATINGYGVPFEIGGALLDPETPAVAQTRLYVGSISKTITALAMLKLAEDEPGGGLVGGPPVSMLDRPIVEFYPPVAEVPEWANFTPRMYLAHATGVPKDPNPLDTAALNTLPAAAGSNPGIHPRHAFVVYRDTQPRIAGFQGQFTARYSNIGYSLIGAAIDWQEVDNVASDEPGYERYVFEKIALDDNKTTEPTMISMCLGAAWRAPEMDNLAKGFLPGSTTPLAAPNFAGWEGPSGGWTMTIGDLGRLMIAINTNARISQASSDAMMANVATGPLLGTSIWGLGIWRNVASGDRRYGKGGDITGFSSDFIAYRDASVGAGIICNQNGVSHPLLRGAIRDIIDPCIDNPAESRPAYCSPPG
jgi:CubicO group peptidase (beta-lactamase class C family)